MAINRREWIQKSLLASSALLLPRINFGNSAIDKEIGDNLRRLHWNENPFGPPASVIEKVKEAAAECNLYWDETLEYLSDELGTRHGLSKEHYLVTSGSTEILTLLGQHVGILKGEILTPWPSFPTLPMFGERCGASVKRVNLKNNTIDLNQLKDGVSAQTSLIFICNPNNPTSTELNNSDLRSFIKSIPDNILIVVDEAYIEFSNMGEQGSMVDLIKDHPNLIIARTFSKAYGCAGFRIGYAISQPQNIQALASRNLSLGMSPGLLPTVAARAAFQDQDFVQTTVEQTNIGKAKLYKAFKEWGVGYEASSTNFIYAKDDRFISDFQTKMKTANILITKWPIMTGHVRISIGKPAWMDEFLIQAEQLLV